MKTLFTRELPGRGWRWHNDVTGGVDLCSFARRTDMEEEPTPEPAVYDAFLLLLWTSPIKVKRTRFNIITPYIITPYIITPYIYSEYNYLLRIYIRSI